MLTFTELLAHLPSEPDEASVFGEIQRAVAESGRKLVVIDDDPTGTQTVHDIELFTTWDVQMLTEALQSEPQLFYLQHNQNSGLCCNIFPPSGRLVFAPERRTPPIMDGLEYQAQHYILQVNFSKRILQSGVRDRQTCEVTHLSCVKGHHNTRRK